MSSSSKATTTTTTDATCAALAEAAAAATNGSTCPPYDPKASNERNAVSTNNAASYDFDNNDDDDIVAFSLVDFSGVNFNTVKDEIDAVQNEINDAVNNINEDVDAAKPELFAQRRDANNNKMETLRLLLSWEEDVAFQDFGWLKDEGAAVNVVDAATATDPTISSSSSGDVMMMIKAMGQEICTGRYASILKSSHVAIQLFQQDMPHPAPTRNGSHNRIWDCIAEKVKKMLDKKAKKQQTVASAGPTREEEEEEEEGALLLMECMLQLEFLAIAALFLYLQANYTGPSLRPEHHQQQNSGGSSTTTTDSLNGIHPHACFAHLAASSSSSSPNDSLSNEKTTATATKLQNDAFHNLVLSELAVDGEWPCPICQVPYFLLVSRCILSTLVEYNNNNDNDNSCIKQQQQQQSQLQAVHLWHARALLAHYRLLQVSHAGDCISLCPAMDQALDRCTALYCPTLEEEENDDNSNNSMNVRAATVQLERGLVEFHFNRSGCSNNSGSSSGIQSPLHYIRVAQRYAGLQVCVTGAMGKRTKFQQQATAQMLVRTTKSTTSNNKDVPVDEEVKEEEEKEKKVATATNTTTTTTAIDNKKSLLVQHAEDEILLERIQFEDEENGDKNENNTFLSTLDQCILLALCLNVKENNPTTRNDGGLTAEEMGAYLARVLDHCHEQENVDRKASDKSKHAAASVDWMIYATALLERSWLEFERSHAKERALLQMQALLDQHTNRLTITQSTMASIDTESQSAPVQERVQNIHSIIYPPQWSLMDDLAARYASMGLVTTAAELYTEIEAWDDVVECYARAGKQHLAQEIVEKRLQQGHETPRMWTALGDLTRNPEHYQRAIDLSKGRYSRAYIALGRYHFEHCNKQPTTPATIPEDGEQEGQETQPPQPVNHLELALSNYQAALAIRPLNASVWFRVGTICMQLKQWEKALQAFSNVVQQEPEEAEAWANVAAIHMHNIQPSEAYPALVESLKHARHNWRVWVSKLYTCLDLAKYDEAIQACQVILDLQSSRPSENIPAPEEKCIRAIVAGTIRNFQGKTMNTTVNGNDGVHSSSLQNGQQREAGLDSARRTLSRVHALLDRMASLAQSSSASSSSSSSQQQQQQSWIFQLLAAFHEQIGQDNDKVLEYLMQEYRSLQDVKGWELDNYQLKKMCSVVSHICDIRRQPQQQQQQQQQRKEGLVKARMLVRGVVKKIRAARTDDGYLPDNVKRLEELLAEIEKDLAAQNVE